MDNLNNRWYAGACRRTNDVHTLANHYVTGRPLYAELSPVTDFREACCRQNENGECNRGGFCNFMHLRLASKELVRQLRHGQSTERKLNPTVVTGATAGWEPPKHEGGRGRSASPSRKAGRDGEDRWTRKTDGEDRWTRKPV